MTSDSGFKWACFISYRSGQEELTKHFIEDLYNALSAHIEPYFGEDLKVYLDRERLKGGDFFNRALATSLCQSLCMIMVYTPSYFDKKHRYCAREFKAMEILEQNRKASKDGMQGLIIPIVFRGFKYLPKEIKSYRSCYDFSKYSLSSRRKIIKDKDFINKIEEIADIIYNIYLDFAKQDIDFCQPCPSFEFPDDNDTDVEKLLIEYKQAFPGGK